MRARPGQRSARALPCGRASGRANRAGQAWVTGSRPPRDRRRTYPHGRLVDFLQLARYSPVGARHTNQPRASTRLVPGGPAAFHVRSFSSSCPGGRPCYPLPFYIWRRTLAHVCQEASPSVGNKHHLFQSDSTGETSHKDGARVVARDRAMHSPSSSRVARVCTPFLAW